MYFVRRWLRIERPASLALHPTRVVDLTISPAEAYARCIEGIQRVLGGAVRVDDPAGGLIEATFGLTFSERLTCIVQAATPGSRVTIESRRGPRANPGPPSAYVDGLASFLTQAPQ